MSDSTTLPGACEIHVKTYPVNTMSDAMVKASEMLDLLHDINSTTIYIGEMITYFGHYATNPACCRAARYAQYLTYAAYRQTLTGE